MREPDGRASATTLDFNRTLNLMAMTLRLSPAEDETLARLARQFRMSKNQAAAQAIDLVAPKRDHTEFVERTTNRLLSQYRGLFERLADA